MLRWQRSGRIRSHQSSVVCFNHLNHWMIRMTRIHLHESQGSSTHRAPIIYQLNLLQLEVRLSKEPYISSIPLSYCVDCCILICTQQYSDWNMWQQTPVLIGTCFDQDLFWSWGLNGEESSIVPLIQIAPRILMHSHKMNPENSMGGGFKETAQNSTNGASSGGASLHHGSFLAYKTFLAFLLPMRGCVWIFKVTSLKTSAFHQSLFIQTTIIWDTIRHSDLQHLSNISAIISSAM